MIDQLIAWVVYIAVALLIIVGGMGLMERRTSHGKKRVSKLRRNMAFGKYRTRLGMRHLRRGYTCQANGR